MPSTYTPIATQTLVSTTASVTFSSIPSTYTDLILVTNSANNDGSNSLYFRFNGDTGSNYSANYLYGDGSTVGFGGGTGSGPFGLMAYYATPSTVVGGSNSIFNVMNYSNTTTFKTAFGRANAIGSFYPGAEMLVNTWRSTAAINSITILFSAGGVTFSPGSTFTLYGIEAA
jgi:hypothetical protein